MRSLTAFRLALAGLLLLLVACPGSWEPASDGMTGSDPEPDDDSAAEGPDEDGDGVPWPADCHDGNALIYPGAEEACDGLDNDCSGVVDDVDDADLDGYDLCEDCDDTDPALHPGAADPDGPDADGLDNDCDGSVDEGADPGPLAEASGLWLLGAPYVASLTASTMINMGISQTLSDSFPPDSDDVLLLFELAPAAGGGVEAELGEGQVSADSYDWAGSNPRTPCVLEEVSFSCAPLGELALGLPLGGALLLHEGVVGGQLDESSGELDRVTLDAVLLPEDVPDIATPAGYLPELMGERALDVDLDGDGAPDGWSVSLFFPPLEF